MTLERDIIIISLQKEKEIERVARFESPVSPTPEHSRSGTLFMIVQSRFLGK